MEGRKQRSSSKKARIESTGAQAKQEAEAGQQATSGAAAAMAAVEAEAPRTEVVVMMEKAKLDCPLCNRPLKPPIIQCDEGHLACVGCRGHPQISKNKCYACGLDGSYGRSPALEDIILSVKTSCPYDTYGCGSYAAYCELDDHQRACPFAPFFCPEKGCPFVGSPPMLIDHIAAQHSHHGPLVRVRYGHELKLAMTPALRWRALLGQEDRSLFLVSLGAIGQASGAKLVCVRANAGAGVGAAPEYRCRLGVEVSRGEVGVMESKVPSSGLPGEGPAPGEPAFLGLYQPLDDMVILSVRIDQLQRAGAAAAGTTNTGMSTPPTPGTRSSSRMQH